MSLSTEQIFTRFVQDSAFTPKHPCPRSHCFRGRPLKTAKSCAEHYISGIFRQFLSADNFGGQVR